MTLLPPPPPYFAADPISPPPFPGSQQGPRITLVTLPPNLLLRIVYELFPQGQPERQRKILYWLTISLRRVNRVLYIACMHVLRSTYLPAYNHIIRAPYTSDPFPLEHEHEHAESSVLSLQRETRVLDLFIALKVREDVWLDDSELHLEREESFKDLFDLMQPRSRLEDLVRTYGLREGVVSVSRARRQTSAGKRPIPFELLSVSFSPRSVGLVLSVKQRKKSIAEVARNRQETLEVAAIRLVRELKAWLSANGDYMSAFH